VRASASPVHLVADVRMAEDLEHLVVTPRQAEDRHDLSRALRTHVAGTRRTAGGVYVPASSAPDLLARDRIPVDLRWRDEARMFAENRLRARAAHRTLHKEVARIQAAGLEAAAKWLTGTAGMERLDPHQLINVAAMTVPEGHGLCVFDEQGAGKTVTLIYAFDVLAGRDEIDFALIFAPKSMLAEWPRDFTRFKGDLYRVAVVTGSRRERRATLASGADVLVTNFETAVTMEAELRALLRRHGRRAILVVDESFYIKNLDAHRTRAVRRLREWCGRAFVLCGTPAPNAPDDLVQQFSLVDFGETFEGVDIPRDRDAARQVVRDAIETRGLFVRNLKSAVLPDLPGKAFHQVLVPLQPAQQRAYAAALDSLLTDLHATDDRSFRKELTSFLARRSALLQICSNPAAVVSGYDEVPAKVLALDSVLEEMIGRRGEKVVLWSFYTASLEALVRRYTGFRPVRFDGSTDVAARRDAVQQFQEDDQTMLFVGNPAAAGAGLTLHRASIAVYESMSNQAAHYLQSLDRIHRRGQTRPVEYLVLLCDGTIELTEYDRLTRKECAAQELLGDPAPEHSTRRSFLTEIESAATLLKASP